jgi:hypothetical protein
MLVAWYGGFLEVSNASYRHRQGGTWGPPIAITDYSEQTYFVSIAVGPDGLLHAIYQSKRQEKYNVYYKMLPRSENGE